MSFYSLITIFLMVFLCPLINAVTLIIITTIIIIVILTFSEMSQVDTSPHSKINFIIIFAKRVTENTSIYVDNSCSTVNYRSQKL